MWRTPLLGSRMRGHANRMFYYIMLAALKTRGLDNCNHKFSRLRPIRPLWSNNVHPPLKWLARNKTRKAKTSMNL